MPLLSIWEIKLVKIPLITFLGPENSWEIQMHIRNYMIVLLLDTNIWQNIIIINLGTFLLEVAKLFVKKQMNRPVFVPLSASTTVLRLRGADKNLLH